MTDPQDTSARSERKPMPYDEVRLVLDELDRLRGGQRDEYPMSFVGLVERHHGIGATPEPQLQAVTVEPMNQLPERDATKGRDMIERYEIEHKENWRSFVKTMPWLSFPSDWKIQVIPPFAGAVARFMVRLPSGSKKSVYFGAADALGDMGAPYWEVHPVRGDTGRCLANEVDELLALIADERAAEGT